MKGTAGGPAKTKKRVVVEEMRLHSMSDVDSTEYSWKFLGNFSV